MDFSGIYQEEQFYKSEQVKWGDLRDIPGTNCYCDDEAQRKILEKIEEFPASGIYFIDSGNYHYMSRIGAGRVKEPFNLLVFDNHTDMQLPAFGGLLSCGGWIASALEEVGNLREVWLVGPDEEAYGQVEARFKDRVHFLSREKLKAAWEYDFAGEEGRWKLTCDSEKEGAPHRSGSKLQRGETLGRLAEELLEIPGNLPLYVSIDKDVLCAGSASTTWSQGDMTLEEMLGMLTCLTAHYGKAGGRILQVDICGECDPDESLENHKNDDANRELLRFWKAYFERLD